MKPVNAIIKEVVEETPTTRTFFLDISFEQEPGQFVMAWIRGVDEIPMALSYENAITVQKVGYATSALFELGTGEAIGIRGPFGNGFQVKGDHVLLIAGGLGAAPLAPFAEKLSSRGIGITTFLGARTKKEIVFKERFESAGKVIVATDDGTMGKKGYVTQLVNEDENYDQIYCCGPEIMMKKVLDKVDPAKVQFSLHRYIKCGLGICGSCCVDGFRVCRDGPVFKGDMLIKTDFGIYRRNESGEKIRI